MSYTVRRFQPESDKEGLLALWAEGLNHPETALSRYHSLYEANPDHPVHTWLLFHDKEILPVGCMSLFARTLSRPNHSVRVGIHFDVMVSKRHRTLGPAMILLKGLLNESPGLGYQALLGMPNDLSAPLLKRAGYRAFGTIDRFCHLLRMDPRLKAKIKPVWLTYPAGLLGNLALSIFPRHPLTKLWHFPAYFRLREQTGRLEQLGRPSTSTAYYSLEEPEDYMVWRYKELGAPGTTLFYLCRDRQPYGYILYRMQGQEAFIENMGLYGQNQSAVPLLTQFIDQMRRSEAATLSVAYFSNGPRVPLFQSLGFIRRESRGVYVSIPDKSVENLFEDISQWSFFENDLDL